MVDVGKGWRTYVVNGLGLQLNAKLPRWSVSLTASPNFLFVLRNAWNIACLMYFSEVNSAALFAAFKGDSAPKYAPEIIPLPRFPLPRFQRPPD